MLLHLLVLGPIFASLILLLSSGRGAYRLALLFGAVFTFASVYLVSLGNVSSTPIDWFKLPGSEAVVQYELSSSGWSHSLLESIFGENSILDARDFISFSSWNYPSSGGYAQNAWLVLLASLLTFIALVFAKSETKEKGYRNFAVGLMVLLSAINGSFLATNIILFFFFFEAMVIPAAVLISSYGGKNSKRAAMTFAIYTLLGSIPMALSIWYLVASSGGADFPTILRFLRAESLDVQALICLAFLLAFFVKTPVFPFHGWQAITYAEAPASLSAILTGAMSKVGVFGILMSLSLVFRISGEFALPMIWLGLLTAVYGGLMALRGKDIKKILAFSSMGHLGLAVAAIFTFSPGMYSAVLVLLVAHGLSAGALFFLSGTAERLTRTRELSQMGGLVKSNPAFGFLFATAGILALAIPGTAGFIGEFLCLRALMAVGPLETIVACFCLILSAAYMLRLIQGVLFGKSEREVSSHKISPAQGVCVGLLLILLILFGLRPGLIYEKHGDSSSMPNYQEYFKSVLEEEVLEAGTFDSESSENVTVEAVSNSDSDSEEKGLSKKNASEMNAADSFNTLLDETSAEVSND